VKMLAGILRNGVLHEAPAWAPAPEEQQETMLENKNSLTARFAGLSERIEQQRRAPDESLALAEAVELLTRLRAAGFTFALNGETVTVSPRPDEQTARRLRDSKAAIVRLLEREQAPEQTGR